MMTFGRYLSFPNHQRDQRRAYVRWCEMGDDEPVLDVRLAAKLTKRRKLTWRVERRHLRQLLQKASVGPALSASTDEPMPYQAV